MIWIFSIIALPFHDHLQRVCICHSNQTAMTCHPSPGPLKYNLHINKVSMWFIHTVTFESTVLKYKITVSNFLFSENDSKLPLDYMTPLCKLEKGIPSAHSVWKNDNVTVQKKKKGNYSLGPPFSPMAGHKLDNIYSEHLQSIWWYWPFYANLIFFELK